MTHMLLHTLLGTVSGMESTLQGSVSIGEPAGAVWARNVLAAVLSHGRHLQESAFP